MEYKVFYPTPLSEIADPENDNIDVCVTMSDGSSYTIVFATPRNLSRMMEERGETFVAPAFRFVVVRRIDRACIEAAIRALASDTVLLTLYGKD